MYLLQVILKLILELNMDAFSLNAENCTSVPRNLINLKLLFIAYMYHTCFQFVSIPC
jgi:hypothetical protein